MKIQLAIGFLVSAVAAVSAATEGTDTVDETKLLRVPISRKKIIHGGPPIASLRRRAQYNEKLYIGDGSIYMVNVAIGTPPQNFELVLDTGRFVCLLVETRTYTLSMSIVVPICGFLEQAALAPCVHSLNSTRASQAHSKT
jgi:hypothetical protein